MTQKYVKLKRKLLITIMTNTLLLQNLVAGVFAVRLAQEDLVTKTDFDNKLQSLSKRITSNKTKHLFAENELKKLKTFHLSYFIGKGHFEEDDTQN